ncbi:hypothetical protein WR25_21609 isoform A [Diploscapter pachys]|uniref:Maelstrom domain-containing protein n=1 Tax=Diploscapter pachys TaxID=2018661 RepID=A0A2A2L4U8_9BILA|nr:hypothetical protein WR25_21609 isoform A [Diploscapter pachys]
MNLEEFELIRQKQREGDISNRLNFAMKKSKTPAEPGRYGGQMYLLTMFVYLDCYINESIQVYPAEITLIKFTIEEGILSTRTWHINFEPRKYFIESDGEVPEWAQENLTQNVDNMNRSLDWIEHIDGGCTIGQAWIELKEEICGKPFVLFDANQNNFIRPGLHFLALESYDGAMRYNEEYDFDRDLAPNLYTIQDFARMINKFDGTNQGPDVDKYIEERFRRPGQPVEDSSYCRLHQSTDTAQDMTGRLHCTLAHGIRLLDAFFDSMRLLGVNPDFPDYFTNQKQYFDVEQMAPGYYDMRSIIPTVEAMPIKSKKTADEMYKSVEHSMRALATNETARLPPRMMAALTHGTSARRQQEESQNAGQWDYDRPGPSHRYDIVLPPASSREQEVPTNTPDASSQIDPNFLPTPLQKLFKCQPNRRSDPNSSACKHVPPGYLCKVNIKNRMQVMTDAEWDSRE